MPTEAYRRQVCPILSPADCGMKYPLVHWNAFLLVDYPGIEPELNDALAAAVREFDPGAGPCSMGVQPNSKPATPEDFARVWNRAMAKLGFTEGNPEA